MSNKNRDIIIAVILIAFGALAFWESMHYIGLANMDFDPGPAFLPMLCSGAIVLFSVIFLITCITKKDAAYVRKEERKEEVAAHKMDAIRLVITIALLFFYVGTFMRLGFLVSSVIYLFLQQLIFTTKENRKIWLTVVISIALPLLCQIFFVNVLNYMLPMGVLRFIF